MNEHTQQLDTNWWYMHRPVIWNMVLQCYDREISISGIRQRDNQSFHQKCLTTSSIDNMLKLIIPKKEQITDVYTSLSVYDLTPILGHNLSTKKQFFAVTEPQYWRVSFDIDCRDNILQAGIDAGTLILKLAGIRPHWNTTIKFSGGKGFHVETDYMPVYNEGIIENRDLAEKLIEMLGLDTIDMRIYSPRREWRCPYSVHHSGKVAMPLSIDEFNMVLENMPDSLEWFYPRLAMQKFRVTNMGMKYWNLNNTSLNRAKRFILNKQVEKLHKILYSY